MLRRFSLAWRLAVPIGLGMAVWQAGVLGGQGGSEDQALEHLRKAMVLDGRTLCQAVKRLSWWGRSESVRIWQAQDKNGANVVSFLSPLSLQGHISVDDGKQWMRYFPDRNRLVIQPSPLLLRIRDSEHIRFNLLKRNYKASLGGTETIAGRPAVMVTLKPHAEDFLFLRRYWIDTDQHIFLKILWRSPSGREQTIMEVISVEFPASIPPDTFQIKTTGTPTQVRLPAPVRQEKISDLEKQVGFRLIVPIQMPFGFRFMSAELLGEDEKIAALRYTDGVANVTLYQSLARKASEGRGSGRGSHRDEGVEVDGVRISVRGDIPDEAERVILSEIRGSGFGMEREFREYAARKFRVKESALAELRDKGLGYTEIVGVLALAGDHSGTQRRVLEILKKGHSPLEAASILRKNGESVRASIADFWSGAPRKPYGDFGFAEAGGPLGRTQG